LRQHDDEFRKRGSAIVAIAPDGPRSLARFWEQEGIPFPAVADPEHRIAELLGQEVRLVKLGRMPAVLVVDPDGIVRAAWYGQSMRDIPRTEEVLAVLDSLGASV
jgi:peroxiredoxin